MDTPIEFSAPSTYSDGNGSTGIHADLWAADGTLVEANLQATQIVDGGTGIESGRFRVTYTGSETGHHILSWKNGVGAGLWIEGSAHYLLADTADVHYPMDANEAANGARVGNVLDGAIGSNAVADIFSTIALAESYAADGSAATAAQLLYEILQNLKEFAISSTTKTVKKLDGSTTAATYTLDSATAPTSITRSG